MRRREAGRWVLLWLLGLDLRVTVLGLAPLLPAVTHDLRLDHTAVGAVSTLPVLLFGIGAALGSFVVGRLGTRRAVLVGLGLAGLGGAARGAGASTGVLFACTFVMGLGIAVVQPALPTLVREWRPSVVGAATAVYGNGLLVGEAIAASLTLPLVLRVTGSWEASLVAWSMPLALTVVLVLALRTWHEPAAPEERGETAGPAAASSSWPRLRDARTWRLGLVQGGASAVYFGANAFLPGYLHATGHGHLVGPALTILNVSQLPASLLLLFHNERLVRHRLPLPAMAAVLVGVAAGMLVAPAPVLLVLAGLLGFTTALMLLLVLALPPITSPAGEVASVSAGMFTVGYTLAFVLPLLGGLASDASGSLRVTLAPALLGALLAAGAAVRLTPSATSSGRGRAGQPSPFE